MERFVVVHYHELALKKGNREYFENRLRLNISKALEGCGIQKVRRLYGRLLIELSAEADMLEIRKRLGKVCGIAYFAEAWSCARDMAELERNAGSLIEGRAFSSFRIEARRADKRFPHTSTEINQQVGGYVKERTDARVDLENPELTCWIDIIEQFALIYVERLPGPGGLPVGTSGKVIVLLSGGIDSPVAAWKLIKRGCTAVFVHFHSFPYTNKESQEKAKQLGALLAEYQMQSKIYLVPFAEVQRHIMVETPLETRVILYRRYMMRIAEEVARREKARVMVTGDSVGQVASQTIENIDVITRAVQMPILRPLIGDDKNEIIDVARRIGTYEISIQPDQDCCSLFVPKHPETKANLAEIERSETKLDVAQAMKEAIETAEILMEYPAYTRGTVRQV